MSEPSARELLDHQPKTGCFEMLATRVEAVLVEAAKRHVDEAYDAALRNVVRMLNGEKL